MPHPDNSGWMSLLAGRPVKPPQRRSVEDVVASRGRDARSAMDLPLPELDAMHERVFLWSRNGVDLTAEIYVPLGDAEEYPVALYLHGGGWCGRSAASARRPAMRIAALGHVVVNLDYGLAPENPFPWAVEDTVYATRWICENIAGYSGDPSRVAIAGDSAGANLAAAAIAYLAGDSDADIDEGDLGHIAVPFVAALLFYGIFDFPLLMQEPGSNVGSAEVTFNLAYLGPHFLRHHRNPLASPAFASSLEKFPPTYLACGDEDSLLGQSLGMAHALTRADVPVTLSVISGVDHAFVYLDHVLPAASDELERSFRWLAQQTGARLGERPGIRRAQEAR